MGQENGLVRRALDLLKRRRPPHRELGFNPHEAGLLRAGGRQLLASLTDEELDAELERRERDRLLSIGLSEQRSVRPPRPPSPFDERIQERKAREKDLRAAHDKAQAAWLEAKAEWKALQRRRKPATIEEEEAARAKVRDLEFKWKRSEEDLRRCRSGRRALKHARSRWHADQELSASFEARDRRRAKR